MSLFRLYCCFVRSVIEYCSPVYHSMLTVGQSKELERMNRQAVRICFGYETTVEEICEHHGIETLEQRRIRRLDSFIVKALGNERFKASWFHVRPETGHHLQIARKFLETKCKTKRLYNSPLNFIIRRANDLGACT